VCFGLEVYQASSPFQAKFTGWQFIGDIQYIILTYKTAPSSLADSVFTVPFGRDDKFVGREDILGQIEDRLQVGRRVSLTGIGGVGYESFHPAFTLCLLAGF
jgi:hypothetical protein